MGANRLGIFCVIVSLLLHGLVAAVTLARSLDFSPQPVVVYEVVLANSPAQAGASRQRQQLNKKSGQSAQPRPIRAKHEPPAAASALVQPAMPTAATAPLPPVAAQLPPPATAAREDVRPSASVATVGTQQSVRDEGAGSPLPQLGSSGAPAFSRQVAPVYPARARQLGREGTVVLKLAIDAEGRLQGVEVVQPAAFGFTQAALTAIRQSSYRPAVRAGRPVQAQALITIRFTLRS
ncbi:TonB family protein [Trichlorobacter sp.]|uniref:energy transducer TonB n=1 Tax=Trichlorobacter sp. TaxID=2911007 RepID=UPI002A36C0F8|nr:TonB family protein [Trichlorobacter sp.]MDY0383855.1 TonB family protein [Trichlorobacter sp.]